MKMIIFILQIVTEILTLFNIKIFDLKGKKIKGIKEINDSNNKTVYIKSYYDLEKYIYYITGNNGCIKSYNYSENKLYH